MAPKIWLQEAKKSGVKHIVYVSTQSVRLPKRGVYGQTKLEGEQVVKNSDVPYTILRPSIIYSDANNGIIGSIVAMSKLPILPIFGKGNSIFKPMYLPDFCTCIEQCLHNTKVLGNTYDIGGPTAVQFNNLVRSVLRTYAKPTPLLYIPAPIALLLAKVIQVLPKPPFTISNVLGAVQPITMNTKPMEADIFADATPYTIGTKSEAEIKHEGKNLLLYIDQNLTPDVLEVLMQHYLNACQHHLENNQHILGKSLLRSKGLLGCCDAVSALLYKHCTLQKKILIAAAVYESHPVSSKRLLPKKRALTTTIFMLILLGMQAKLLLLGGFLLHVYPNYLKHNCGI